MNTYTLKYRNDDFCVSEVINICFSEGRFHYYRLKKSGLSTFQCINMISDKFQIPISDIGYAGLKDEDGTTTQYISVFDKGDITFAKKISQESFFSIEYVGQGEEPIKIGHLCGNEFNIVVRNLDKNNKILECSDSVINYSFINYYDTQRFGLPGEQKLAHLIGKALLEEQYGIALYLALQSKNITQEIYSKFSSLPERFWLGDNLNFSNFFLNAFDSLVWNDNLSNAIAWNNIPLLQYSQDNFFFNFVLADKIVCPDENKKIIRHRYNKQLKIVQLQREREPIVQTEIISGKIEEDMFFQDRLCLPVKFFLPAGAYATMLINQFVHYKGSIV